jgi:hypothetical protein
MGTAVRFVPAAEGVKVFRHQRPIREPEARIQNGCDAVSELYVIGCRPLLTYQAQA